MATFDDEFKGADTDDELEADGPVTSPSMPVPQEPVASPEKWAESLFPPSARGRQNADLWKHAAASSLHGWEEHAHHSGAPFQLTLKQYMDAIEAATTPTSGFPMYQPSEEALSPHASYSKLKARG